MAKQIDKSLDQLTNEEIKELIAACLNFKPEILGEGKDAGQSTLFRSKFGWFWPREKDFEIEVGALTNTNNIVAAEKVLEKQLTKAPTQPAAARPGIEELKAFGEQKEAHKQAEIAAAKKGIVEAQEFIDQQLKRADQLRKILEKQKLNAEVKDQSPIKELPTEEVEALNNLKEQAIENQQEATVQLAEEIKTRIAKDTPPEILDQVANQTAYDTVQILVDNPETSPAYHVAYFQAVAKSPGVVEKVIKDPALAEEINQAAINLADFQTTQFNQSRKMFAHAFGDETANYLYRGKLISLSETQSPEYNQSYSLSNIPSYHTQLLSDQSAILNAVKDVGADKAQAMIGSQFGSILDKKIAALPKGHFLQSEIVSRTLQAFRLGTPVNWIAVEGASPVIRFAVSRGYGPLLGTIQSATGWKLGISKAAAEVGKKVTAGVAAKAGGGLLAKAATALSGIGGGPIGIAITTALTFLGSKVIDKIVSSIGKFIKEHKEIFLGLGALGLIFGTTPIRIISAPFLLAGGGAAIAAGGLSMAVLGGGILRFFRILGRNLAITIGTPILITLLVFPVVVALILFIINSGAYIVPPSPYSASQGFDNPYMSVTKTASPSEIGNPSGKTIVTYTVEISALKSPLTGLKILSKSCKVTKKDKSDATCPIEKIPDIPAGTSVSPGSPYSFTFTADFGPEVADSIVFDSIEIGADAAEEAGVTTSGSETVCVGDCPTSCVKVVDNADPWPGNAKSTTENAALALEGGYPNFMSQVCAEGEVNLCYRPGVVSAGGWHVHNFYGDSCDVYFKGSVLTTAGNALFMLAHELTHHIQRVSGGVSPEYFQKGADDELPICSYPDKKDGLQPSEGMAEANGLYVSVPSWVTCIKDFRSQYPHNYNFAKDYMK